MNNAGQPTAIYTGVHPQTVCVAFGSPDLRSWQKAPQNPVLAAPAVGRPPLNVVAVMFVTTPGMLPSKSESWVQVPEIDGAQKSRRVPVSVVVAAAADEMASADIARVVQR